MTTVLEALEQAKKNYELGLRQHENVKRFLEYGYNLFSEMNTDNYLAVYGSIDNIPEK